MVPPYLACCRSIIEEENTMSRGSAPVEGGRLPVLGVELHKWSMAIPAEELDSAVLSPDEALLGVCAQPLPSARSRRPTRPRR